MGWMRMDITKCSPTKFLPKCSKCRRQTQKATQWQSYANFYDDCVGGKYNDFLEDK